jgi:dUTP pyrophosphatase
MKITYELLFEDAKCPERSTSQSAGWDVCAYIKGRALNGFNADNTSVMLTPDEDQLMIEPGQRVIIPLGFKATMSPGHEAQVRPRSGLSLKTGLAIANAPGTIDADYPDEWGVILRNATVVPVRIVHGDRIAQIVFAQVIEPEWSNGEVAITTDRTGGFGSTGMQ